MSSNQFFWRIHLLDMEFYIDRFFSFLFSVLYKDMFHCLLISIVSEEKPAVFINCCPSICNMYVFSDCFLDILEISFLFGQQFSYNIPVFFYLHLSYLSLLNFISSYIEVFHDIEEVLAIIKIKFLSHSSPSLTPIPYMLDHVVCPTSP